MVTRERAPVGQPCWIDVMSSDVDAARSFYGGVVGWEPGEGDEQFGGYYMYFRDGAPIAGGNAAQDGELGWRVYFAVADAELAVKEGEAAGATVETPPSVVGDLGVMAVLTDPAGARVGLWQAKAFQGFATMHEPGAPSWFELHSRDHAGSLSFYSRLFGWTFEDAGGGDVRYSTVMLGDDQFAGIMDATTVLAEGQAPYWTIYLDVESIDASLAAAARLGGHVLRPAEPTPNGQTATLADPDGSPLRVMQP